MRGGTHYSIISPAPCRCDGIGRRSGLKIHRWRHRAGSSPATGTSSSQATYRLRRAFSLHCKAHRALILLLLASKSQPLTLGCDLVFGADLNAAASILLRCSQIKAPAKAGAFIWGAAGSFQCSAEVNSACAKVFAQGENACTAHQRRPTMWGPTFSCNLHGCDGPQKFRMRQHSELFVFTPLWGTDPSRYAWPP